MSADRGGVAAGRDVVADLIVTGDRNTFFVGGYQRLSEAYIDPREVFERVDVERFVGRGWLVAELDAFLAEQPCGYFVVEAAAGLGKTSLLAHLVATRGWVHHFSELAPGEAGIAAARMSLAAQLIRAYDLRDAEEGVLSEAAASRPDFLRGLLSDASARLQAGEKLVFVVDALDEAGTRPGENVLGLPQVLPKGVFAVVSKRTVPVDLYTESPRKVVRIDPDSDGNRQDVHDFVAAAAPQPLAEAISAKSGGVWIYVRYALQHVAANPGTVDPDTLPEGLWAWYHRFWRNWADAHAADWRRVHLPLLATLAAAREDLTLEELARLAGVEPAPAELPAAWGPYLIKSRERPRRHRLYHASLRDFLHGRSTTDDSAEQDFADDLGDATRAAHSRLADCCLTAWRGEADEEYGVAHVTAHLRFAERHDELFALVDEPDWRTRRLLGDPSAGRFLSSVTDAWDCATDLDRQAVAAGHAPPHLRREIVSALSAEDVHSFATYLPAEILERLVAARIWTVEQALAATALSPYPYSRAWGLAAVLPHLPEARRVAELREFFAWAEDDRERALAALAGHVPASLMPDALRFAAEIDLDGERADALEELAPHLPAALLEEALAVATAIENTTDRIQAVGALLPRVEGAAREEAFAATMAALEAASVGEYYRATLLAALAEAGRERLLDIAYAIEDAYARATALTALLPHLEGEPRAAAWAAVLDALGAIEDSNHRADAVEELAPLLPGELVPAATAAAAAIEDADERVRALVALAPRLDRAGLDDALAAATTLEFYWSRVRALAALAPHLPDGALGAVDTIDDEVARARALAVIAPSVAEPRRAAALDRALEAARALDDVEHRCEMLTALAPSCGADVALEALAAAREIEDDEDRADALVKLAPVMQGDETAGALRLALAAVAAIDEAHDREERLSELEPALPDALLPDAVSAAIAPVETRVREQLFALLDEPRVAREREREPGPPLSEAERRGALAAAVAIEHPRERADALAELCERIPEQERTAELVDALARTLDDAAKAFRPRRLARTIGILAPELPDALLPHAFAIASRIWRARMRRRALEDLASAATAASPSVVHECFDIALRASVEQLDVPRFVRTLLPIVDRLGQLDGGGGPWRPS